MSRSETAYHHGNLAPVLEDAALMLMATQGHATLSLREVARQAGVSHNAPYHHFGDRIALLKRLSERSMAELLDAVHAAELDSADLPAAERAVAIGAAYVGYAAAHPERFQLIYDPEVCVPGAPSAAMAPLIDEVERVLASGVAALVPEAETELVSALTTAVWATVHGLSYLVIAGHIDITAVEPAIRSLLVSR